MDITFKSVLKKDKLKYDLIKQRGGNTLPYIALKLITRIVYPAAFLIFIGKLAISIVKLIIIIDKNGEISISMDGLISVALVIFFITIISELVIAAVRMRQWN